MSDIHLRRRRSRGLTDQITAAVRQTGPHAILLGGDLVDQASELPKLSELVDRLFRISPVIAVGGNHDSHVGLPLVRGAVQNAGGKWIHENTEMIAHDGRVIVITGPEAPATVLTSGHVKILCAHNPRIWRTARKSGYDLVPNDDGINDRFRPQAIGALEAQVVRFYVFDRWGGFVFKSENRAFSDPENGWDGQKGGKVLGQGVYTWLLEVAFSDGGKEVMAGDVVLVR